MSRCLVQVDQPLMVRGGCVCVSRVLTVSHLTAYVFSLGGYYRFRFVPQAALLYQFAVPVPYAEVQTAIAAAAGTSALNKNYPHVALSPFSLLFLSHVLFHSCPPRLHTAAPCVDLTISRVSQYMPFFIMLETNCFLPPPPPRDTSLIVSFSTVFVHNKELAQLFWEPNCLEWLIHHALLTPDDCTGLQPALNEASLLDGAYAARERLFLRTLRVLHAMWC